MEPWQFVVGIISAIIIIFLRSANQKAHKQIVAATKLRSYLLYWKSFIIENNLFIFFREGVEWNEKIEELVKSDGSAIDLSEIEKEKRKILDELKEAFKNSEIKISKDAILEIINKLPPKIIEHILQYCLQREQNLINGKTFISDEEASHLGIDVARVAIELKMNLIQMTNTAVGILIFALSIPDEFELKNHIDELSTIIWKGIVISKHIDTLTKRAEFFTSKSLWNLTIRNFISTL